LSKALGECDVFIAVIGALWYDQLRVRAQAGARDYVRDEIGEALARDILVIPVTIDHAQLPHPEALPDDLHSLALRQKQEILHERFGRDMDDLIQAIRTTSPAMIPQRKTSGPVGWRRIGIVVSVIWFVVSGCSCGPAR
jgi:hypothetical protein